MTSVHPPAPGRAALLGRVCDPRSVGWAGFWATLGVGLLIQVLGALTLGRMQGLAVRVAALVLAEVLMYGLALITVRPVLGLRWMRGRWVTALALFALAGVVRQFLFTGALVWMGQQPLQPAVGRVLAFAVTVATAMGFAAVLSSLVRDQCALRQSLAVERQRLRHLQGEVADLEASHSQEVQAARTALLSSLAAMPADEGAALALRATADSVVRPLSHELAGRPAPVPTTVLLPAPQPGWWPTLREAASGFTPYPGASAATGLVLTTLLGGVYGAGLTAVLAVLNAGGTWMCLGAISVISRKAGWQQRPAPTLVLIALSQVPLQLALIVGFTASTAYPFALASGAFIFWPLIAYAVSVCGRLVTQQLSVNAHLLVATEKVRAETARVSATRRSLRRRLALGLHGPVQSAITAAALRLERRCLPDDIREARADIDEALARMDASTAVDFAEGFDLISRTWAGACAISMSCDLPAEALAASHCTQALLEITGEACGNAVRHGRATRIEVRLRRSEVASGCLQLEVEDNGAARSSACPTGIGSALLDELSLGWQREYTDHGCILSVVLPLPRR